MMSGSSRKSGRFDDYYDEKIPNKKPKQAENEEPTSGAARKSVPIKYFSMTECPFGEGCGFLHVIPSGFSDDPIAVKFTFKDTFVGHYGRGDGSTLKLISSMTKTKLSITDHESGSSLKTVEFRGSNHGEIGAARELVWELTKGTSDELVEICPGPKFKTRPCVLLSKGFCHRGVRCHYAHGAQELRKSCNVYEDY
ncbi:hypothetical protein POM88_046932 [Heracleum sosnowskyi]|uniref:C3H1-type domain-containing protein n=1 Tax=Heracleum sosnowskyi TaxID=360622 RepID=A0AAD8HA22_9APIA|nr:hypothetical protein POM88_046932 [Heracleum sosnowskyi]